MRDRGANCVDVSVRKTTIARVSESTLSLIEGRLLAIKPELERHFDVATTGYRKPEFLVYREGDFFTAHADSVAAADMPDTVVTGRRVSVVVFLNGESATPSPGSFCGGSLTFYGLWDDPAFREAGFPLTGEPGLLIAFRPQIVHSVSRVTDGERYTIVSWLES